ncbi:MAG TPA: protein kinase, partial [Pseudomonadota bacterium]|nr:protein kinase [Pseudomonadota bacterium]
MSATEDKPADLPSPGPGVGLSIGHYRLVKELGRGGMGVVFLAVHDEIGQRAAVKLLLPSWSSDARYVARFLNEARAASKVHHPGLVKIFDFGRLPDGTPYLLMEYLEGERLRERLLRLFEGGGEGVASEAALRLIRQLALSLAALHEAGIIHRDLKPENVILVADAETVSGERAKLLDFGIAKSLEAQAGLSAELSMIGTAHYMSPEQLAGERVVDGKADVYALGAMLYELLCGAPPYSGGPIEIQEKQQASEPPPLRPPPGRKPAAPDRLRIEVEPLVQKMLCPQPEGRPTMAEVAEQLRQVLNRSETSEPAATSTASSTGEGAASVPLRGRFRRLASILLPYAGISVSALQCVDLAVNRYVLSPRLVDLCLSLIFLLLPPTLLLGTWPTAAVGRRRWLYPAGLAVSLVGAIVILFVAFRGHDLGTATRPVKLKGEDGKTVQRNVPKREFVKHLAIFLFDNESGDKEQSWLQLAVPDLLEHDLAQDHFIVTREGSGWFAERLKLAGLDLYDRVPLALKQELARALHMDHLLSGSVRKDGADFVVRYALYQTQRGQPMVERTLRGADLLRLVDEISTHLRRDLGMPAYLQESAVDLPVSEISTSSLSALRHLVEGTNLLWFRNNLQQAQAALEQAVIDDPGFALAHFQLAILYVRLNQIEKARGALRSAGQNEFRLNERARFNMNWYRFNLDKDVGRQDDLLRQWTTLYPEDAEAWHLVRQHAESQHRLPEAIAAGEKILTLDPDDFEELNALAELYDTAGRQAQALSLLQDYAGRFPRDPNAHSAIGELYLNRGEFESARTAFESARALDPERGLWALCDIEVRLGHVDKAEEQCKLAVSRARTSRYRAKALTGLYEFYRWRGMLRRAIEVAEQRRADVRSPIWRVSIHLTLPLIMDNLLLGQTAAAQQVVERIKGELKPGDDPISGDIRIIDLYFQTYATPTANSEALLKEAAGLTSAYTISDAKLVWVAELKGAL